MASKTPLNLDALSIEELSSLIFEAQTLLNQKQEERRTLFVEKIRREAEELGFKVEDLFGQVPVSKASLPANEEKGTGRKPVAVKYRDPDNPENVWSGRGREPVWLREKVAAGAEREAFLVTT